MFNIQIQFVPNGVKSIVPIFIHNARIDYYTPADVSFRVKKHHAGSLLPELVVFQLSHERKSKIVVRNEIDFIIENA